MKRLILGIVIGGIVGAVLILAVMAIFNTSRSSNHGGLRLVKNDSTAVMDIKNKKILTYGDFMELDSTDFILIPVGLKTNEDKEGKAFRSGSSEGYSESNVGSFRSYKYNFYAMDFENCNNIVFYNKKNDETHLLLQKPAIISQFYFPFYNSDYVGVKYYFILLGIREDDTNADGYINTEDAEKVYVVDLSGKDMFQINPDNTQLIDWFIDKESRNILMKVRYDSNKDQKFNSLDEVDILKTSIDSPIPGKEIISKEIKTKIKKILERIK